MEPRSGDGVWECPSEEAGAFEGNLKQGGEHVCFALLAAAVAAALAAGSSNRAGAMPLAALGSASPVQAVAICFYPDGWHGPGFYRCGYRLRAGEGWIRERREEFREHAEHREDWHGHRHEDRHGY
jgi:hypothetical protein